MNGIAVHNTGDQMYLIMDQVRDGFLTWEHDNNRYIMAFTTGDKAEEYNEVVLKHQRGDIAIIQRRDSKTFARKMVKAGVRWMIIDYPVVNDQDFWDKPIYEIGSVPREQGRNYSIVDLKAIVARA